MLTLNYNAERPKSISDLAAELTDLALEVLSKAGGGISVDLELETWHALTAELQREFDILHRHHRSRPSSLDADDFHLGGTIEQVVHRAAVRVLGAFEPERCPTEIEALVRPAVAS